MQKEKKSSSRQGQVSYEISIKIFGVVCGKPQQKPLKALQYWGAKMVNPLESRASSTPMKNILHPRRGRTRILPPYKMISSTPQVTNTKEFGSGGSS